MELVIKNNLLEINEEIGNILKEEIKKKPNLVLGLDAKEELIPLFNNLIIYKNNKEISFKEVRTFNVCEFNNLRDEEKSNKDFMKEHFFDHVDFSRKSNNFPYVYNYNIYDELIENLYGLDLLILVINEKGELGFNFGGAHVDQDTYVVNLSDKVSGVTMGLKTILGAKKIIAICVNDNKYELINKLGEGKYDVKIPCTALNLIKEKVVLFSDLNLENL